MGVIPVLACKANKTICFLCSYCLSDSSSEGLRAGPIEHETQKSQEASALSFTFFLVMTVT